MISEVRQDVGIIFANRIGEAEATLKELIGRVGDFNPGDAERATAALDALRLCGVAYTHHEWLRDCDDACSILEMKSRFDATLAELERLTTEDHQIRQGVDSQPTGEPVVMRDPSRDETNRRLFEIQQRIKQLTVQAKAEHQKLHELFGQSNRAYTALIAAGVDLRIG